MSYARTGKYSRTAATAKASELVSVSKQGCGYIVIKPATELPGGPTTHSTEMPFAQARHHAAVAKARFACELMGLTWDQVIEAAYSVEDGKLAWRDAVKRASWSA